MDLQAIAEAAVELYSDCDSAYIKKMGNPPKESVLAVIFDRAHHHYITTLIGKQRSSGGGPKEAAGDDLPSDKQIALIDKMGGPWKTIETKQEAHDWIEKNKDW